MNIQKSQLYFPSHVSYSHKAKLSNDLITYNHENPGNDFLLCLIDYQIIIINLNEFKTFQGFTIQSRF